MCVCVCARAHARGRWVGGWGAVCVCMCIDVCVCVCVRERVCVCVCMLYPGREGAKEGGKDGDISVYTIGHARVLNLHRHLMLKRDLLVSKETY